MPLPIGHETGFLHDHPGRQQDPDHVIVDRKDWEIVYEAMQFKGNDPEAENIKLRIELETRNAACEHAIDDLWKEIILKQDPDYGDWEYAGQAFRHLLAEFGDAVKREQERCAVIAESYSHTCSCHTQDDIAALIRK